MIKYVITQEGPKTSAQIYMDGKTYVLDNNNCTDMEGLALALISQNKDEIRSYVDVAYAAKKWSGGDIEIKENTVYYQGKALFNSLTDKIVRLLRQGLDAKPLISFLEKLMDNPSEHSRKQLYDFLDRYNFPICEDGDFLAYKKVRSDYGSVNEGYGIVNGIVIPNGTLSNRVGNVVEIPRERVEANPTVACGTGLHAGSLEYVENFSGTRIIVVKINPQDVVSVPQDSCYQKIRCCKYIVVKDFEGEIVEDYSNVAEKISKTFKSTKKPKIEDKPKEKESGSIASKAISKVANNKSKAVKKKEVEKEPLLKALDEIIPRYTLAKSTVAKDLNSFLERNGIDKKYKGFIEINLTARASGKIYLKDLLILKDVLVNKEI